MLCFLLCQCCFTFLFLDDWSTISTYGKVLLNGIVVAFACCFAGCFVVGYVRYRYYVCKEVCEQVGRYVGVLVLVKGASEGVCVVACCCCV